MELVIPKNRLPEQPSTHLDRKIRSRIPHPALRRLLHVRLWLAVGSLLLLLALSGPLLRTVDPTAAVVDVGVISLLLLALLALICFIAVGHWILGLLWPILRDFPKYYLARHFKSLQPWQQLTFYFAAFFALLYAFVSVLAAIM